MLVYKQQIIIFTAYAGYTIMYEIQFNLHVFNFHFTDHGGRILISQNALIYVVYKTGAKHEMGLQAGNLNQNCQEVSFWPVLLKPLLPHQH